MSKSIVVIGAGFSGLSSAMYLAKQGYQVNVLEKNNMAGGRARYFEDMGFKFDMGPSWYWMPDVFEKFFADFGHKPSDFYQLKRLDPAYRVFFSETDKIDVPGNLDEIYKLFNSLEKNGAEKLQNFLKDAEVKYQIGMNNFVYKPGRSVKEYMDFSLIVKLFQHRSFQPLSKYLNSIFTDSRLLKILEFPVLFLGATAKKTPALFSLMNYADLALGTWYPMGGFNKIVEGMYKIAAELGVTVFYNSEVSSLDVVNNRIKGAMTNKKSIFADYFVASADYHHVDQQLLGDAYSNYSEKYWEKKKLAPSAMLIYMGLDIELDNLLHHNLFFDVDFEKHADQIYTQPAWPNDPALYVSCTTKTDKTVAPKGHENVVVLIPVAPNLNDSGKVREHYFNLVVQKLAKYTKQNIRDHIVYHRIYSHNDFLSDYNSFKGNAYGLSNTLDQTGILRPSVRHNKIDNLYYTGQFTVPGPGVPPSLISGKVVANELIKNAR